MNKKPTADNFDTEIATHLKTLAKSIRVDERHVRWLRALSKRLYKVGAEPKLEDRHKIAILKLLRTGIGGSRKKAKPGSYEASMLRLSRKTIASLPWMDRDQINNKPYHDPSMTGMLLGDAADYLKIALYLKEKKTARAANYMCGLDTAAREEIPYRIYNKFLPF